MAASAFTSSPAAADTALAGAEVDDAVVAEEADARGDAGFFAAVRAVVGFFVAGVRAAVPDARAAAVRGARGARGFGVGFAAALPLDASASDTPSPGVRAGGRFAGVLRGVRGVEGV
ncbi:hypothetical protein [Microbacterium sp. 22296]|uniref:hypothetical protein n=1 Tax=Microbacterium sp. 22296 TaxID=3453903 RepID=UPI003F879C02